MAGNSCCAQVSASPSGREAPSRKEKAEREWSSTYIHCQNCQIAVIAKIEKHLIRQLLLVIKTLCTTDFQFWQFGIYGNFGNLVKASLYKPLVLNSIEINTV